MQQTSWSGAGVTFEDWDSMLTSVVARLRRAVVSTLPHELNGATAPLQTSVLECADALDQLHVTLRLALAQPSSQVWPDGSVGDTLGDAVTAPAPNPASVAQP